jgi:hypothetical protein
VGLGECLPSYGSLLTFVWRELGDVDRGSCLPMAGGTWTVTQPLADLRATELVAHAEELVVGSSPFLALVGLVAFGDPCCYLLH